MSSAPPVDFETYGTIYEPKKIPANKLQGPGDPYPFKGRITPAGDHPPASGRYHLFVSLACPFAQRTLIVRSLKGLEDTISVSIVDPLRDGRGWAFRGEARDTSGENFGFLREAYEASAKDGRYRRRVSVPVLWDKQRRRIVSNNFPDITQDLNAQFNEWARFPERDLYPTALRHKIDELNAVIGPRLNHGVYGAGFAASQAEYESAYSTVFAELDRLEALLQQGGPYLLGENLTEADVRLWVTLIRFDPVYFGHFKLNRQTLTAFPALWEYTRRLYAHPAFASTTDFSQIKQHYYGTQRHINPTGIVPTGPAITYTI